MANKNVEMLKCFFKVMNGNKQQTFTVVPKMYAHDIYNIDYDFLKRKKITNLIFDIDNTIMPVNDMFVTNEIKTLFNELEKKGFNVCIMSNNHKERVIPVASELKVGYLFEANKPNKSAYARALVTLNSSKEETAMVGDQMLTDIKGANEYGIYSILVEPVSDKHDIKTGTSRVLQDIMTKKLEKTDTFTRFNYYNN